MRTFLLTKREAAERARVHVVTLNTLIRSGHGPAVTRLGGKALIREDSLQAWLEASTERSPTMVAE
ncbi:helix-turn-helix domain-containing protein [Lichenicola cladoniae]|uniref:Helix-turn-helix domain-containing protein n=1 Tax=Lichenicola cladoniae TaxID=1484109 RepID=A0A6M8HUL0_9PROT|nr:helix-turn-helix domain-containing protein [Acetobacteraceae bacterium]QKE91881.1 helix-turn-helix domain-containing protein [Lichenicola cladoniae]